MSPGTPASMSIMTIILIMITSDAEYEKIPYTDKLPFKIHDLVIRNRSPRSTKVAGTRGQCPSVLHLRPGMEPNEQSRRYPGSKGGGLRYCSRLDLVPAPLP
eukprot:1175780-Prorocentrum_minimum.AAC.2